MVNPLRDYYCSGYGFYLNGSGLRKYFRYQDGNYVTRFVLSGDTLDDPKEYNNNGDGGSLDPHEQW